MTWRGSTDIKDRIFAALIYVLPLVSALPFGQYLFQQFPPLALIAIPLSPVSAILYGIPFAGLIIFILLFAGVVRNEKISHFIRFNTMQAMLIDILLLLLSFLLQTLAQGLGSGNLLLETLCNVAFLGSLAACFYGVIQSVLGRYAEIPTISEAAYTQVR